jgi:hypothetical protein
MRGNSPDPDLFETVTAATERALTTVAKVKEALDITFDTFDNLLQEAVDRVSALAAEHCNLTSDSVGSAPTFGEETLRATWLMASYHRGPTLLLPWRRPITEVTLLTECGVTLTSGTDFLLADGELVRIRNDRRWDWLIEKVVVEFKAGWALPDSVPPNVEARVIDQIKLDFLTRKRDPSLKSMQVPDLFAASFATPGSSTVGDSGLLVALENALSPYRRIMV